MLSPEILITKLEQTTEINVRNYLTIKCKHFVLYFKFEKFKKTFSFVIPDSCFDGVPAAVIRTVVQLLRMRRPADVSSDTSLPRFMSANNSPE
jgi:hypothetical protein